MCVAAVIVTLVSNLRADDDLIYIRRGESDNPIVTLGVIDEFTGGIIRYHTVTNPRPKEDLTANVLQVKRKFSSETERAERFVKNGELDAAEAEWMKELKTEPRAWVRREIRANLIRVAWRRDRWMAAAQHFLAIVGEDSDTFHWPVAPLMWAPAKLSDSDRPQALEWLADRRPVARLLGASFLLKDAAAGPSAKKVLDELQRDVTPHVAGLAKAQLWRERLGVAISDGEIASWRGHVAWLPEAERGGPQYLLGRGYMGRSQFDRAAAELLYVPLMGSQNEPAAARASLDAGEALLRAGRREDAVRVLKETAEKFAWSTASRDAQARLAELERAAPE
jgi:hypothetical protein